MPRALTLLALLCALVVPGTASAAAYLPPEGQVWHGVTAGNEIADFTARTGKHPAVWQHFIKWGGSYQYTIRNSAAAGSRLMLAISTASGQHQPERYSPGELARGEGDRWLVALTRDLAELDGPVYLRLMGEMNNCDNAYASHHCNGRPRDRDHSAARFKQASKRTYLIMKGGDVAAINAKLRRLGLPAVDTPVNEIPRPKIEFMWTPMTGGSPMIRALEPGRFWPGSQYVDWVGTSFYSKFPTWHYLNPYYRNFAVRYRKPFAFAEWAMWGSDNPAFVRQLFSWTRSHRRVRMLQYNQGNLTSGPFRLERYPRAARELRKQLRSPRFAAFVPELAGRR